MDRSDLARALGLILAFGVLATHGIGRAVHPAEAHAKRAGVEWKAASGPERAADVRRALVAGRDQAVASTAKAAAPL